MQRWLLRSLAQRVFDQLAQADPRTAQAFLADDAVFRFPGRNPFAADYDSKEETRRWLERFARFRPHVQVHDVITSGPPWDLRGCMHFTDRIGDPSDPDPYVNEGVCLFRIRRGRVVEERVFLDTQAVADFFGTESAEEFFAGAPGVE